MEVAGAREVAVEFFTMSKSYNMAGWRIGFMVGNKDLVSALARIKSYHDYGTFTPIQVASIAALEGPQDCVEEIRREYQRRRDVLARGLHEAGWMVDVPKASMYIWAKIPEPYRAMGSLEFAKKVLADAKVAVSPGIGFGDYGDTHVRFALIENEHRIRQAVRGIKDMLRKDGLLAPRCPRRPRPDQPLTAALQRAGTSMTMKPIRVGLLGLGTVGRGTWNVLRRNQHEITRRAGRGIEITAVAVRDVAKARAVVGNDLPITTDPLDVVRHPDIDIVVELIGGYEPARSLVLEAIARGKHVVTANKALLALHGNEIFEAAQRARRDGRVRRRRWRAVSRSSRRCAKG